MIEITFQNIGQAEHLPLGSMVVVAKGQYGLMGDLYGLGFNDRGEANRKRMLRRDLRPMKRIADLAEV